MSNTDATKPSVLQRLPPSLAALLAHVPALLVVITLLASAPPIPALPAALLVGVMAAAVAAWWKLPPWWRLINLAFVPMLWAAMQMQIDHRWFLAGFILLAVTSLGAVRTRVPLYLSSRRAAEELARRIPASGVLIDLGCGLGDPLTRIHRIRPDAHLLGVEAAPLNWCAAKLRLLGRADVRLGSFWNTDLSKCDVAYAYLSPAPMARLWDKARAEMKPGSLFVSNSFTVPDTPPDEEIELNDLSHARLLVWRMP